PADMLLVALHRAPGPAQPGTPSPPGAGFLIARLLRPGELSGRGDVTLRDSEREDLAAGRLQVRLFTRQRPFGDVMVPVVVTERDDPDVVVASEVVALEFALPSARVSN